MINYNRLEYEIKRDMTTFPKNIQRAFQTIEEIYYADDLGDFGGK